MNSRLEKMKHKKNVEHKENKLKIEKSKQRLVCVEQEMAEVKSKLLFENFIQNENFVSDEC